MIKFYMYLALCIFEVGLSGYIPLVFPACKSQGIFVDIHKKLGTSYFFVTEM